MAENNDNPANGQRDKLDQFLTRNRSEVVSNLLELSRTIEPLTILFDSGKHSFPTSVINVISENTEVVFECSGSEEMNTLLLSQSKGTVIGQPGGIRVRFLLEKISATQYEGETVFVAPLPKEHYRMQRRRLFRINTQMSNPVQITFSLPNGDEVTLHVGNISSGGLRLDDVDHVLTVEAKQILTACSIQIPDVEPFLVNLEVQNSYEENKKNGKSVHCVGCVFTDLSASHEREIQNYINSLQRAR